jgi:hypothetical protein
LARANLVNRDSAVGRVLAERLGGRGVILVDGYADANALFICDETDPTAFAVALHGYLTGATAKKIVVATIPTAPSTSERFTDSLVHAVQAEGAGTLALLKHAPGSSAELVASAVLRAIGTNIVADIDLATVRWRLARWIRVWRWNQW